MKLTKKQKAWFESDTSSGSTFLRPHGEKIYSRDQVTEWGKRHGIDMTERDLRCAFEDAATTTKS